jgi:chromosome segregation protein
MFLKALTLKGFKSFADKTDLAFEPGVTVVVGPNGSGKSNLVDAVAWVLGAQGARALRGAKMDDVIFAGTTKKSALGRAEVSLTIDNSDGTLPIEFTEVSITRTLFRSGESEYRLNDVPCRLLDIQELLSDSRIGRTQHVIIGQGQLDSVLNARPEDRRAIIEEAAGVLKYRKRREKAQRRLEATEGHLVRLNDLVREVRRQLSPLERQADAARRHDGVRDELNSIRLFLAGKEIKGLRATLTRIDSERETHRDKEQQILSELSELDVAVLDAEAALMKVGDSDVASWLTRAERLVARTGATKAMLAERKRSIELQLEASADESVIESLLAERASLQSNLEELEHGERELAPKIEAALNQLGALIKSYDELMAQAPSDDAVRDYEEAVKERKIHESTLAMLRDRLDGDIARRDSTIGRVNVLQRDHDDAESVIEGESGDLEQLQREHNILSANVAGLRDEVDAIHSQFEQLTETAARSKAHAELLEEEFERTSNESGIEKLRHISSVLGTLSENISIDERVAPAADKILADIASAIVVDSPEAAKGALEQLSSGDISARLFVLGAQNSAQEISMPYGAQPLSNFITSSNEKIRESLVAVLSHVAFVEGDWKAACDVAIANPHLTIVTSRGDVFGSSVLWSVGASQKRTVTKESVNIATREAENNARALEECIAQRGDLVARYEALQNSEREMISRINEMNARHEIARQSVAASQKAITSRKAEIDQLEKEIAELRQLINNEEVSISELIAVTDELRDQKENADNVVAEFEQRRRDAEARKNECEQSLRNDEIERGRITTLLNDVRQRIANVEERLAKDPEQEQMAIARRQALTDDIAHIEELVRRTLAVETASIHARDLLSAERQKQTERAHESTSKLETLRAQRKTAEEALVEIRDLNQKSIALEAETKTRLTTTIEMLRANHDCEPEVAMEAPEPEIGEGVTLTSRARDLERELKLMGPINPLAVQEFDELNERHVFLNQQLDDVKSSRKELHKVIKTIDEEIVTVFEKAFEDVQKHFADLFQTLFSGGAGRLTLTDPNDMLNTGIEMEARPSGKNVRRLSLLSGGERSLTAIAFLFAVFRSRPSPFYIMDEVEAALDEPNLLRFLDLVEEFRHDAQLVIVSHQKRTMEAADELYGVSMAPGGSSRAIKQRVEVPTRNVIDLVAEEKAEAEEEAQERETEFLESSI